MQLLPEFGEEQRSVFFTILICAVLGISFVLFVVAYRNLKAENSQLKEQIGVLAGTEDRNISEEVKQNESTVNNSSELESQSNKIEPLPTKLPSPIPTLTGVQPTSVPTIEPTPTPIPFITAATLSIEPQNGDICGTNFKFRGYITASSPGVVTYRWKRTDAENVTMEPYPTVTFENAGTKEINYYLTLTHNADAEAWFEITSPESVASNRARYVQQNC